MARFGVQSRRTPRAHSRVSLLGVAASCVAGWNALSFVLGATAPRAEFSTRLARGAGVQVDNPVKTVSDTLADFYKAYPQPPVLPMYRPFLVDLMTQTHLAVVDSRFVYDPIFALGLKSYFDGVMGSYDKIVGSGQNEKIWDAMLSAMSYDPAKVKADAEAATAYAKATKPADILKHLEGTEKASDEGIATAFGGISKSLYTMHFSIGIFKMMEAAGVEVTKENVEEWLKALKVTPSKGTSDLDTYKANQNKLQKGEEMLREIEIREKKKLAQRLEEKAKKLAEKAAAKASEATEEKKE